jgi:glycosyltransferase involved in cell wall biosynthesis
MPASPLISVVIPCYNDGRYLPETIQRLKQQTFTDYEIIICNDGSTDELTLKVLDDLSKTGITVLHKANGRMSSARNHGVKHATGKYIAALDADDYFHPSFFQKAVDIMEANQNTATVTSYIQLFGEFSAVAKPRAGTPYNHMFKSEIPAVAMVRKSCFEEVGGYDESMGNGYEDWEFYIRIAQKGWNIHVIPEKLLFYRQTKKSTLQNFTHTNKKAIVDYIVDKHKDWYVERLKELIADEAVLYRHSRISYPVIFEMLKNRITQKYP